MGNNFTISVNLQKMKNAGLFTIQGKTGKKRCICIPVDDNPEIFPLKDTKFHFLCQMSAQEE